MKYKTLRNKTPSHQENWVIEHYDRIHVVDDKELYNTYGGDLQAYKDNMRECMANEIVRIIIKEGGIEMMEDYDVLTKRTTLAGRCKRQVLYGYPRPTIRGLRLRTNCSTDPSLIASQSNPSPMTGVEAVRILSNKEIENEIRNYDVDDPRYWVWDES